MVGQRFKATFYCTSTYKYNQLPPGEQLETVPPKATQSLSVEARDVELFLAQSRRRWPNFYPTLARRRVLIGSCHLVTSLEPSQPVIYCYAACYTE